MLEYKFPADSGVSFAGQSFARGFPFVDTILGVPRLTVHFYRLTPRDADYAVTARTVVPADLTPDLFAMAAKEMLRGFGPSRELGVHLARETDGAGRSWQIVPEMLGSYPCSTGCESQYRVGYTMVYAMVKHPEHGVMGVNQSEYIALGLPNISRGLVESMVVDAHAMNLASDNQRRGRNESSY